MPKDFQLQKAIPGMGLSKNDYSDDEKDKVARSTYRSVKVSDSLDAGVLFTTDIREGWVHFDLVIAMQGQSSVIRYEGTCLVASSTSVVSARLASYSGDPITIRLYMESGQLRIWVPAKAPVNAFIFVRAVGNESNRVTSAVPTKSLPGTTNTASQVNFALRTHNHSLSQVIGLESDLDSKQNKIIVADTLPNAADYPAGTLCAVRST